MPVALFVLSRNDVDPISTKTALYRKQISRAGILDEIRLRRKKKLVSITSHAEIGIESNMLTPDGPGVGEAVAGDAVGLLVGDSVGDAVVGDALGANVAVSLRP